MRLRPNQYRLDCHWLFIGNDYACRSTTMQAGQLQLSLELRRWRIFKVYGAALLAGQAVVHGISDALC